MTEEAPVEPLTDEEQAQLADLQYRQAMVQWQARETEREARLAAIEPVVAALGTKDAIEQTIAVLEQGATTLGDDTGSRAQRVAGILCYDALKLLELHEQLQVAEPEPVAPGEAAP